MEVGLRTCIEPALAEQVRAIYTRSFRPAERAPFPEILDGLERGDKLLFLAQQGGTVLGFALAAPLACKGVYLLEYMAVAEEVRGQGVGTALLRCVRAHLSADSDALGILIEVEPPNEGAEEEQDVRRRRVAFYVRNDAHMVEQARSYLMPSALAEDAIPMRLMWLPLGPHAQTVPGPLLRECIASIYVDVYGLPPSDSLVASALRDSLQEDA